MIGVARVPTALRHQRRRGSCERSPVREIATAVSATRLTETHGSAQTVVAPESSPESSAVSVESPGESPAPDSAESPVLPLVSFVSAPPTVSEAALSWLSGTPFPVSSGVTHPRRSRGTTPKNADGAAVI